MSAHTPGPWFAYKPEGSNGFWYVSTKPHEYGQEVATCYVEPQSEIDAHLIAAAPELLDALRWMLTESGEGSHKGRAIELLSRRVIDAARAAIAKAEGKS